MTAMFVPLGVKSSIIEEIAEVIKNEEDWQPYYNFMVKQVPDEVIQKDPFLRDLYAIEPFIAGVTMMKPMTVYDWHTDERRGATLNMLVHSGFSLTMFTTPDQATVRHFAVAEYKPQEYHFFNTQKPHTVFNFDQPRYLFTIEFLKDKTEFPAEDLLNVLEGLEEYGIEELQLQQS
jgi:hypothetical protein